ncbi:GOLPH3/VPS74 family protein [Kitasatospora viridis]|uniref:Golgi phosphoprotein 3 GPP34 n=1 Tax=Kitasatospora viridis TaxID=281105 RepID=A0A561UDI7_9ACTN|nr:GPP34 family phosphoprotein [Kitasatospora viridis]TWF97398.1 Golgi phosphoprotein 3 GPP34 [Kitasatospora viridis]
MTDLPDTLHARLFLLAHDPERGRLTGRSNLPLLLRAAQLADLLRLGLLRDERGRPVAAGPAPAGLDPLLAEQLRQIAEGRPRSWHRWIQPRRPTVRLVRESLAGQGVLRLEERRLLGLFPVVRSEPRDPRVRKALTAALASALRDPLTRVGAADAALVALADAARLSAALNHRQRREHKERIADLAALCGPVPAALRRAIRAKDAAAASG